MWTIELDLRLSRKDKDDWGMTCNLKLPWWIQMWTLLRQCLVTTFISFRRSSGHARRVSGRQTELSQNICPRRLWGVAQSAGRPFRHVTFPPSLCLFLYLRSLSPLFYLGSSFLVSFTSWLQCDYLIKSFIDERKNGIRGFPYTPSYTVFLLDRFLRHSELQQNVHTGLMQ